MLPEYPIFKPLEIEDLRLIIRKIKATSRNICELSAGNLFIWKNFDHPQITCVNHNLCILISPPNETPYFLEPIGQNKPRETADILLQHAGRISRSSKDFTKLLPEGAYTLSPLRNQFDYIYSRDTLVELKGKKFDGKRNHIKRFRHAHPAYEYLPLTAALKDKALKLFEKWFAIRSESKFFPKLAHTAQKGAITAAFSHFEQLGLMGGYLREKDSFLGFTLGSKLNPDTVSVHFLYGDPDLHGATQTILWEACGKTYAPFKFVDLEQDLGIPGLRTAKLSYHPLKLEEKFEITGKDSPKLK